MAARGTEGSYAAIAYDPNSLANAARARKALRQAKTMRILDYVLLPPIGSEETPARGSLADLLRAVPYLLTSGLIPPLAVANDVLRSGLADAGMSGGCRWSPFEVSEAEFAEVVRDLEAHGDHDGRAVRYEEPPAWVTTNRDWGIWVAERVYSIPAEENRRFSEAIDQIEAAMNAAAERRDEAGRIEHLCRLSEVAGEHSAFLLSHRKPSFLD